MANQFWFWWQHIPENLNPVIFRIGSFRLQYYGLMYLIAFAITYFLVIYRIKTEKNFSISRDQVESIMTYMIIGVILGGRLGYIFFYNLHYYIKHPLETFLPFEFANGIKFTGISGMSYHGGLIGVIISLVIWVKKYKGDFWEIADLWAPAIPLGYTFGRIGNFINGELYGRITSLPIGMYFPKAGDMALRHPSQLYEAFFEGIFLFVILWNIRKKIKIKGMMLGCYLMGYGIVRFFIEFFRQPDAHIGYVFLWFSEGQILCALMVMAGIGFFVFLMYANKNRSKI